MKIFRKRKHVRKISRQSDSKGSSRCIFQTGKEIRVHIVGIDYQDFL